MLKYENIINYNYEMKHPRMSIKNRSAQFSPFSALTGYEEMIKEKGRITEYKKNISDDNKELLDIKLQIINENLLNHPNITIKYFIKDTKKNGGKYEVVNGIIKRIDLIKKVIILTNNLKIKIDDIIEIDSQDINFNDII